MLTTEKKRENLNYNLTAREQQVVELAADGKTDKEIASELSLSTHTIATYWRRLRLRFRLTTRTAVVVTVLREKARLAQALYEKELAFREAAERSLAEALDQTQQSLSDTTTSLGEKLKRDFQIKADLQACRQSLDQIEQVLEGGLAFIHISGIEEPHQTRFMTESAASFSLDRDGILSGDVPLFAITNPEDLGAIVANIQNIDLREGNRMAYLFRMTIKGEDRYMLELNRRLEGTEPAYGGVILDVQDLVEQGVIDPQSGVAFRLDG